MNTVVNSTTSVLSSRCGQKKSSNLTSTSSAHTSVSTTLVTRSGSVHTPPMYCRVPLSDRSFATQLEDEAIWSSKPAVLPSAVLATMLGTWHAQQHEIGRLTPEATGFRHKVVARRGGRSIGDEVLAHRSCVLRPPHAFVPIFQCRDRCMAHPSRNRPRRT